jgi:hypothetical protein
MNLPLRKAGHTTLATRIKHQSVVLTSCVQNKSNKGTEAACIDSSLVEETMGPNGYVVRISTAPLSHRSGLPAAVP